MSELHSETTPTISIQGLEKIYPATQAGFRGLNLKINSAEWISILGPSGSGKSTLLRLLAGLEAPTAGSIQMPKREVGFVFQEPALLPWKTVRENIELPFQIRKRKPTEQVEVWMEKLRLTRFANQHPHELSGGMKMRVSIARALVMEPTLLLLDEPFAALDEPIRIELGMELREVFNESRPQVFFVTHSITEALWLADRVLVLKGQPGELALDEPLPWGSERSLQVRASSDFQNRVEKCFRLLTGENR